MYFPNHFSPLLKVSIDEREVFFNLNSQGFLFVVIREQSHSYVASLKGVPNRLADPLQIRRVRVLLKEECLLRFEGKSLLILPKARGGFPPIDVDDCIEGPEIFSKLGVTPLILAGKTGIELLAAALTSPYAGMCVKGLTDLIYETYKGGQEAQQHAGLMEKIEATLASNGNIENELKALNDFYTQNLPKAGNLERVLSQQIERKAREEGLQAIPQLIGLAGILCSYKNQRYGTAIMSIGKEMGTIIPAAFTLAAAAPVMVKVGAGAIILAGFASIVLAVRRFFIKDEENPVIDTSMQIVLQILAKQHAEERAALARVEKTLGIFYLGLSEQLQGVQRCIASFDKRFNELESQIESTHQAMDLSFVRLVSIKFSQKRGAVMFLSNAGISASEAKKNACLFLDWAINQSRDNLLTGKSTTFSSPRLALQSKDTEFQIGYLNDYLASHFPTLATSTPTNGIVWSEAAHAYMELRLRTAQFDKEYAPTHYEDFRAMVEVGIELQKYIRTIQQSEPLFQHLVDSYLKAIQKIQKHVRKEKSLEGDACRRVFKEVDDAYALILAFSHLGFSRSIKTDPYFISLLNPQDENPHAFRNSEAIKKHCRIHGVAQWSDLYETLFETAELFLRALDLKREALARDTVCDDSLVVGITLLKLNAFWKMVFTQEEDLSSQPFDPSKPTHTLVLAELCGTNLLAAAKYGLLDRVASLIHSGADPNQKHPLDLTKRTPLHYAALYGNEEVVEYLLEQGVAPTRDSYGMTPLDLAKKETVIKLLLPLNQNHSPLDALLDGKRFQLQKSFSCAVMSAKPKEMFHLHISGSRLVSVQPMFKLQLFTRQWDLLTGKVLMNQPNGANGIRGCGSLALFPGGAISILYDFSKETLTQVKVKEKISNHFILPYEQCIINQSVAGTPFSILSTETGEKMGELDIGSHTQATLCHYCPGIGQKILNPYHLPGPLPPFTDYPQSLLIRKVHSGKVSYEIWHLPTKTRTFSLKVLDGEEATEASFSKTHAAITFKRGSVRVFDLKTKKEVHRVTSSHHQPLVGLWKDKLVATLGTTSQNTCDLATWKVGEEKPIQVSRITNTPSKFGFIQEGVLLLWDTHTNSVFLHDLEKSEPIGHIHVSNHYITRAAIEGEILILSARNSSSPTSKLFFYHLRTQQLLQELPQGDSYAFSDDTLVTHSTHSNQLSVWKF